MQDKYLSQANFAETARRVRAVAADAKDQTGAGVSYEAAVRHMTRLIEISLEERPVNNFSNLITRSRLYRRLMIRQWGKIEGVVAMRPNLEPDPKFKPKAKLMTKGTPFGGAKPEEVEPMEEAFRDFEAALRRFCKAVYSNPTRLAPSPNLGKIPLTAWSLIHGLHVEMRLRQFGA